jgi:ParB family chromosome partitioning protein
VLLLTPDEIFPNPHQPRRVFDEEELAGLAESIRHNGILQPLTVRKLPGNNGGYVLIAGERRLRAARIAGLRKVPCILSDVSEEKSAVLALIENLQRQDLGYFEEAEAVQKLMIEHGFSQEDMARTLGKAQSTLSNKLRLLKLPADLREQINEAKLTERHARALLRLEDETRQRRAMELILTRNLNVGETDQLIDRMLAEKPKSKKLNTIQLFRDLRIFVNTINRAVDTMRRAGIPADADKRETDEYLEYTVRIPKTAENGQEAVCSNAS